MNPHISDPVRKLLQRLTATGAELELHRDTREWFLNIPGHPSERLINSQERAANAILKLCLLETVHKREPIYFYRITKEANQCLLNPSYTPAILRHA